MRIPVPKNQKHVIYVWLDALTNYLSALDYPDTSSDLYKSFWPADLHVIGKDILGFTSTFIGPAFLMAANIPLPKEYLDTDGYFQMKKMSVYWQYIRSN